VRKSIAIVMSLAVCTVGVMAGEAVSEANGKLGFSMGNMDSDFGKNLTASYTMPLASNIGFQVDGLYTYVSDRNFGGVGAHLFWRDSEIGLIGLTAGGIHGEDVYALSAGAEAEYYLGAVTLGLRGGITKVKFDGFVPPVMSLDATDYYVGANLGYYPLTNLLVSLSCTRAFDNNMAQLGAEYLTPLKNISLFADIALGDQDYEHALFGIRYYFGGDKGLQQRHREDDPPNMLVGMLHGMGLYGAEYNREAQARGLGAGPYGGGAKFRNCGCPKVDVPEVE